MVYELFYGSKNLTIFGDTHPKISLYLILLKSIFTYLINCIEIYTERYVIVRKLILILILLKSIFQEGALNLTWLWIYEFLNKFPWHWIFQTAGKFKICNCEILGLYCKFTFSLQLASSQTNGEWSYAEGQLASCPYAVEGEN